MSESVLIVGAGPGLSSSLARLCASKKMKVFLASRNIEKLSDKGFSHIIALTKENLFKRKQKEKKSPELSIFFVELVV